jgi:hypothetical protein
VVRRCTGSAAAATYDIQYIDDSEAHGLSFVLLRALDDESEAVTGMAVTQGATPVEVDGRVSVPQPGDLVLAQKGSSEKWFMALISRKYVLQPISNTSHFMYLA